MISWMLTVFIRILGRTIQETRLPRQDAANDCKNTFWRSAGRRVARAANPAGLLNGASLIRTHPVLPMKRIRSLWLRKYGPTSCLTSQTNASVASSTMRGSTAAKASLFIGAVI
jgi:hypothetical protein